MYGCADISEVIDMASGVYITVIVTPLCMLFITKKLHS